MKKPPLYRFVGKNDEAIFIIDPDEGGVTITNVAEAVVTSVFRNWANTRRIIYRDTEDCWGELKHDGFRFIGFAPLTFEEQRRWQEWLVSKSEGEAFPPLP